MFLSYIMFSMPFIFDTLRRGGSTFSDYWNQVLVNILSYTIPEKYPLYPIRYRTAKSNGRKRLLIVGLMSDYTKAASVPNIDLSG